MGGKWSNLVFDSMLFQEPQSLNICAGPPFLLKLPSPHTNSGVSQVEKAIHIDGTSLCFGFRGYC